MEKQEIGSVVVTYNKNTKTMYTKFIPSIQVTHRAEGLEIKPNIPDEEKVGNEIKKAIAKWFSKVSELELSDKFSNEFEVKNTECIKYKTGELKAATYKISMVEI